MTQANEPKVSAFWEALHVLGIIFPFVLMIGAFLVPPTRYVIWSESVPEIEKASLYLTLGIQLFFAAIWIGLDWWIISNEYTSGAQLKRNVALSSTINNILLLLTGYMVGTGQLCWWMPIPVIAMIADDYIVSNRAIVNALQKPIFQQGPRP